jgi:hypothetical protein
MEVPDWRWAILPNQSGTAGDIPSASEFSEVEGFLFGYNKKSKKI